MFKQKINIQRETNLGVNLKEVILGKKSSSFLAFCKKHSNDEFYDFLLDFYRTENLGDGKIFDAYQSLIEKYISNHSPKLINFQNERLKKVVLENFNNYKCNPSEESEKKIIEDFKTLVKDAEDLLIQNNSDYFFPRQTINDGYDTKNIKKQCCLF